MTTFTDTLPADADEVVQKSLTDVQRELDSVPNENRANVFLEASWLSAIVIAAGNRNFDTILQLTEAVRLTMPDTTEGTFLDQWAGIYIGARVAATGSSGNVIATGVAASVIPIASNYQSSDGIEYVVTANATIALSSLSVTSITRSGNTATVTTAVDHNLASNVPVLIAGAVQTDYNGTFAIQVTGLKTFTYPVENSPVSPATGTITADFTSASVPIEAVPPSDPTAPFGQATNQILDTPLTLQVTISGVDSSANVDFSELTGGADEETDDAYKTRMLDSIRNPVSHFSVSDIDQQMRLVAGVTRTFIKKSGETVGTVSVSGITRDGVFATATTATPHGLFNGFNVTVTGAVETEYNVIDEPVLVIDDTKFAYQVAGSPSTPATGTILSTGTISLGQMQAFFTRDDDDTPIPDTAEVATVKAKVLEITPANTPDLFINIEAPTALPVAFTFTELTPDSASMRTAVTANLQQFFDEEVTVGVNIDEDAYRAAIFNTVDTSNGFSVTSFALSTPTGDVVVGIEELPTLGAVAFP